MPNPKRVQKAILDVVENQIRNLDPPETKETLDRLISQGVAKDEARRLIAFVVASEIFGIMKHEQVFDHERYVTALRKLPELPWEGQESID
ncbi:MAG: hypothetical protein ND866_21735 [Pyrinomonadaceae bacterium]|nr:hypothetical protein [Pyrinomonadaceae bacterium]